MRAFLDTSALVKLYDPTEPGVAALLQRLLPVSRIVLSELARIEFVSAFQRKVRRGDISPQQAASIIVTFRQSEADYAWVPLGAPVLTHAAQLLELHSAAALRSLDAIQLACALAFSSQVDVFFTHDQRLEAVAQASGLLVG